MSKLDPNKLTVEFREGATKITPVIPRRYTLTHSDLTGDLFLTIGPNYAYEKISTIRDEVLGEWLLENDNLQYHVYLQVNGGLGQENNDIRNLIFRRELPLALEAIRYGDKQFFEIRPEMDRYPIMVHFLYDNFEEHQVENWGTFSDYNIVL